MSGHMIMASLSCDIHVTYCSGGKMIGEVTVSTVKQETPEKMEEEEEEERDGGREEEGGKKKSKKKKKKKELQTESEVSL